MFLTIYGTLFLWSLFLSFLWLSKSMTMCLLWYVVFPKWIYLNPTTNNPSHYRFFFHRVWTYFCLPHPIIFYSNIYFLSHSWKHFDNKIRVQATILYYISPQKGWANWSSKPYLGQVILYCISQEPSAGKALHIVQHFYNKSDYSFTNYYPFEVY